MLRVIALAGERIDSIVMDPASSAELLRDCHYLEELLAHFLLVCIHMFQSGIISLVLVQFSSFSQITNDCAYF